MASLCLRAASLWASIAASLSSWICWYLRSDFFVSLRSQKSSNSFMMEVSGYNSKIILLVVETVCKNNQDLRFYWSLGARREDEGDKVCKTELMFSGRSGASAEGNFGFATIDRQGHLIVDIWLPRHKGEEEASSYKGGKPEQNHPTDQIRAHKTE